LTSYRRSCRALLVVSAAIASAAIAPAAANAAVSVTITGDDGNPIALAGALNIRNMNPTLAFAVGPTDNWAASVAGPIGAAVAFPT
jgi:predicted porin